MYGRIRLVRSWCPDCSGWSFVRHGALVCCGKEHLPDPKHYRRMSEGTPRELPPLADRKRILREQDNRCFYCEKRFDSTVYLKNRKRTIALQWDHCVPWSYSGDSSPDNFVAACCFCNRWKGCIIFKSLDDARVYLYAKWKKAETEGGTDVPNLLKAVPGK